MTGDAYCELRQRLALAGYDHEWEWSQNVQAPADADAFFAEYAHVVVNSGMKAQIAELILDRIWKAIGRGDSVRSAFGHPGKAAAIQDVYERRGEFFEAYLAAEDKVAFCEGLPWIGGITKWHLAKNFGVDCAKPDRHLVRIAAGLGETVDELCARLAEASGDRVATVDLILWRAANLGWL